MKFSKGWFLARLCFFRVLKGDGSQARRERSEIMNTGNGDTRYNGHGLAEEYLAPIHPFVFRELISHCGSVPEPNAPSGSKAHIFKCLASYLTAYFLQRPTEVPIFPWR